jgi:hypothetical protein
MCPKLDNFYAVNRTVDNKRIISTHSPLKIEYGEVADNSGGP